MVDHDHAVTVAVQRNAQVGFLCQNTRLQGTNISCPHLLVNVQTIRLAANGDDFRTQFAEDIRGDVIGRAISTVHHNFEVSQAQLIREGTFTEFDITARRINDTVRFTQLCGIYTGDLFFHFGFNGFFHVIRELGAVNGEEFNAVVVERVVRS